MHGQLYILCYRNWLSSNVRYLWRNTCTANDIVLVIIIDQIVAWGICCIIHARPMIFMTPNNIHNLVDYKCSDNPNIENQEPLSYSPPTSLDCSNTLFCLRYSGSTYPCVSKVVPTYHHAYLYRCQGTHGCVDPKYFRRSQV